MVPEAVSDAEMILRAMIFRKGTLRWDGRSKLIVDGHALLRTNLAQLLEYVVLPYHLDISKPRGLDIFTRGLARIGAEPRHIGNQCVCLVDEKGDNKH